jgi:hypothetical protein
MVIIIIIIIMKMKMIVILLLLLYLYICANFENCYYEFIFSIYSYYIIFFPNNL